MVRRDSIKGRILVPTLLAALLMTGCGGQKGPIVSHGHPVEYWVQELKKPDAKARRKAVVALGHVGTTEAAAVPALIDAIKDKDAKVRDEAILALLNIGPDANDAIPALTEAQNDKDATVRAHATKALERMQSGK